VIALASINMGPELLWSWINKGTAKSFPLSLLENNYGVQRLRYSTFSGHQDLYEPETQGARAYSICGGFHQFGRQIL
jgi:hypothetical protein